MKPELTPMKETPEAVMTAMVYGMPAYIDRAAAIDEVHACPYLLIQAPRELLQIAFMNDSDLSKDKTALHDLSEHSYTAPFYGLTWDEGNLHCEKHAEFSMYLWSTSLDLKTGDPIGENPFKHDFIPPGPVISGTRLHLIPKTVESENVVNRFKSTSLCYSLVENGAAAILSDFTQDTNGLSHILILDYGLTETQAGALAQCLLDIETYRTLALLAIPLIRSTMSDLRRMESRLAALTDEMRREDGARRNNDLLLRELTSLATELEACVAASLYRFGASHAYYQIVEERLEAIYEEAVSGYCTWRDFLQRRIGPAMRTCQSVKERQAKLSANLATAISLLRSWIDVELERQNRDLLISMNNRARLQLRLQQTVEGLSVAAISYYTVSLLAYFLKGIPGVHDMVAPELVIAILVPVVILTIWWIVRRIRKAHGDKIS